MAQNMKNSCICQYFWARLLDWLRWWVENKITLCRHGPKSSCRPELTDLPINTMPYIYIYLSYNPIKSNYFLVEKLKHTIPIQVPDIIVHMSDFFRLSTYPPPSPVCKHERNRHVKNYTWRSGVAPGLRIAKWINVLLTCQRVWRNWQEYNWLRLNIEKLIEMRKILKIFN